MSTITLRTTAVKCVFVILRLHGYLPPGTSAGKKEKLRLGGTTFKAGLGKLVEYVILRATVYWSTIVVGVTVKLRLTTS